MREQSKVGMVAEKTNHPYAAVTVEQSVGQVGNATVCQHVVMCGGIPSDKVALYGRCNALHYGAMMF